MNRLEYIEKFASGYLSLSDLEYALMELEEVVQTYEDEGVYSGDMYYQDALTELGAFEEMLKEIRNRVDEAEDLIGTLSELDYTALHDAMYKEAMRYLDDFKRPTTEFVEKLARYQNARERIADVVEHLDGTTIEEERARLFGELERYYYVADYRTLSIVLGELVESLDRLTVG